MNVEFTDRYGGNPPSALTICRGQCEGTGWIPAEPNWLKCAECRGTGKCSTWRAIAGVPRWVWRGLKFIRFAMQRNVNPPHWTFRKRLRVALWCSFGADLRRLFS